MHETPKGYRTMGFEDEKAKTRHQTPSSNKQNFIPLRDLLRKNHDDRVQDYLQ